MEEKITVICYVAASFCRPGELFTIGPKDLGVIIQAPAWIRDTLMFKLLAQDGSIKYVEKATEKRLENEPLKGISAEGKEMPARTAEAPEGPVEVKTEVSEQKKRTRKKKDDAE